MAYSILDLGNDTRKQALSGLREATNRENEREIANENIKQAERAQTMSSVGMGASMGMMIGGPVGGAIGAAGGLIIGEIF